MSEPEMTYEDFIASKATLAKPSGIAHPRPVSKRLFPFQREIVDWALRLGRAAIFADCGLGKGPMALEWSRHVAKHTGGRVLVLAPLAVAQQFIREGAKFGIAVTYAREQSEVVGPISVTNYERLDRFDTSSFAGVVLDESSILKSFMGATKRALLDSFQSTPFRLCCTATPAPNDHLELGNHAEFLGVLSSHEMIARWFINNTALFGDYRLKGHAVVPFWDWVASWARCVGKPSDIGHHSDAGYDLPPLRLHKHVIEVDVTSGRGDHLFRLPEMSATAVHAEKRRTVADRARKIASVVAAEPGESWIVWCETDYEADALTAAIPDAVEVRGPDSPEKKEAALVDFSTGQIRVLVTKPKIAGFGLNWQHCARVAYVGATFSYESFYQTIRRAWRFGQLRPVEAHIALAHTELSVLDVMMRKQGEHETMKAEMFAAMRRAQAKSDDRRRDYSPTMPIRLPSFLSR